MKILKGIGILDIGIKDEDYERLLNFCENEKVDFKKYNFGYHINIIKKQYGLDFYILNSKIQKRYFVGKIHVNELTLFKGDKIFKEEKPLRKEEKYVTKT